MKFVNIRELKCKTSAVLKIVYNGQDVIVTYHGKPRAIIHGLSEEELEDYAIINYPKFKAKIAKAYKEYSKGNTKSIDDLLKDTELHK